MLQPGRGLLQLGYRQPQLFNLDRGCQDGPADSAHAAAVADFKKLKGCGPEKAQKLALHFKSTAALRDATPEQLQGAGIPGIKPASFVKWQQQLLQ